MLHTGMFSGYTCSLVLLVLSSLSLHSSYDNSQLCSCSADKTVILWDVATGQVTRKLRGHAGVRAVEVSGLFLLSISENYSGCILLLM